jgi:Flp pilus assembly protein TadG
MKMSLNDTRGASAVEFAIILPILLLILFGIIEFGFYIYNQQMLTNAAREGARVGIVASIPRVPPATIETVVQDYFNDYAITFGAQNDVVLDPNPPVGYNANAAFGDDPLVVTVSYQYSFLVLPNILGNWINQELGDMSATAAMRYE